MAVDDPFLESLQRRLVEVLGHPEGGQLVHLVTSGATRDDIERLELKLELIRHQMTAVFRGELVAAVAGQTRTMLVGMVTSSAVVATAIVAAVRL